MKRQVGFFLLLTLLCAGILYIPYRAEEPVVEPMEKTYVDNALSLRVIRGDRVEEMTLSHYLAGVVAGELPENFPMEAKKAQAVAARTFTLQQAGRGKHSQGDICTNSTCCQAFSSRPDPTALQAVEETDGLVLVYGEDLIEATYFSCSGGRTEAAVAVWGNEIPYLQAVNSPGEEDAPRFREVVELTPEDFIARLQTIQPDFLPIGSVSQWFGEIRYTEGNGIDSVEIGGLLFRGTELRKVFGLRSTNIRFAVREDKITMSTLGNGHRVGMSQYGAKAMAEDGRDFREILGHYYGKTEIKRLSLPGEA